MLNLYLLTESDKYNETYKILEWLTIWNAVTLLYRIENHQINTKVLKIKPKFRCTISFHPYFVQNCTEGLLILQRREKAHTCIPFKQGFNESLAFLSTCIGFNITKIDYCLQFILYLKKWLSFICNI
jgi:hypothetical protein